MDKRYEINDKHGKKILARGKGINNMLKKCYEKKLSDRNSVLVVLNPGDLDSRWIVYNLPE